MTDLLLHPRLAADIKLHSRTEHDKGGYEAVGFLARKPGDDVATVRMPMHNHASDPTRYYFVEPWEQYRAEMKLTRAGMVIVGVYHSHPNGEARPSKTDEKLARPGEYMVIYSVAFDELRGWQEENGHLVEVAVHSEMEVGSATDV